MLSCEPLLEDLGEVDLTGIDWVIVGGESGHEARECSLDWIHSITEQCANAQVPCFVKQLGAKPYYLDAITNTKTPYPIKSKKGEWVAEFPCHFLQQMPLTQSEVAR